MLPTGVFYHPSFSKRSYFTLGARLRDFPQAFDELKKYPNFRLVTCPRVSEELILKVHSPNLLEKVKMDPLCSTAWHSAGGVVMAGEMVYEGRLRNAFCYIGAGGHHAGRSSSWGFCCFNDVVLSITNLREKHGRIKVAILDTDAHHGDGTRELLMEDKDSLHFCICDRDFISHDGTKIDVSYWGREHEYVKIVEEEFVPRVMKFRPSLVFWYFGHDTHIGDYGDIGLTVKDYVKIAQVVKELAAVVSDEKLVVVLGGGSLPQIAKEATLAIIKELLKT
jgi:acetoin utilization deacetylase AcuC-like enzyme